MRWSDSRRIWGNGWLRSNRWIGHRKKKGKGKRKFESAMCRSPMGLVLGHGVGHMEEKGLGPKPKSAQGLICKNEVFRLKMEVFGGFDRIKKGF